MTIRHAKTTDSEFIAYSVADAVGMSNPSAKLMEWMQQLCLSTDTLYSWQNTLIAETNGQPAGSLTLYPGNDYATMRHTTFELIKQAMGQDFSTMDMEALPGEYYLDSLSVRPQFRRQGIGTALLRAGINQATIHGEKTVTLACEPGNKKAYKLYHELGFRRTGTLFIFGENYWKMALHIDDTSHR